MTPHIDVIIGLTIDSDDPWVDLSALKESVVAFP